MKQEFSPCFSDVRVVLIGVGCGEIEKDLDSDLVGGFEFGRLAARVDIRRM